MPSPKLKHVTLALAALLYFGCGSDDDSDAGSGKGDAGSSSDAAEIGDGRADVDEGTGEDAGPVAEDAGECVPQGCEEQGFECGTATDLCGESLDCTGIKTCVLPQTCGTDNRCGCTPKTCDELSAASGSRACGSTEDGCGKALDCGGCDVLGGNRWLCNEAADICECTARSQTEACEGRSCGVLEDGCGGTGLNCGSCSVARECSDAGACACKAPNSAYAATACGAKTCGSVLLDGCEFDCGPACTGDACASGTSCVACDCGPGDQCDGASRNCCTPTTPSSRAALCATQACGSTVTDTCTGAVYPCDCAAGSACVDKALVKGATANTCVSNERAALLGGYVVRTHQFSKFLTGVQRAETVSLIRIVQTAGGGLQMEDKGCVATTVSDTGAVNTMAPAYFQIPTQTAATSSTPGHFQRDAKPTLEGVGFTPQMPSFCSAGGVPTPQADFDAYPNDPDPSATPGSGSQKQWLGANAPAACTCPAQDRVCEPAAINQMCLPDTNTASQTKSTDCRLNDPDADGRPGFTVVTSLGQLVTAITASNTSWGDGEVRSDGFHTAHTVDPPTSFRAFTGCSGNACAALGAADGPCGDSYNRVQFRKLPLATFAQLDCGQFYNDPLDTVAKGNCWKSTGTTCNRVSSAVKQTAIDAYFDGTNVPLPACGPGNPCPTGALCKAGSCIPMTTRGACAVDADCGAGWVCDTDPDIGGSCWPVSTKCVVPPAK